MKELASVRMLRVLLDAAQRKQCCKLQVAEVAVIDKRASTQTIRVCECVCVFRSTTDWPTYTAFRIASKYRGFIFVQHYRTV